MPDATRQSPVPRPAFESKISAPAELAGRVLGLPSPLVFTNGCFDILHRGHVTLLAEARALGAALIVALNSDASVKRLGKGIDRPVNDLPDRLAVIAALRETVPTVGTDRYLAPEIEHAVELVRSGRAVAVAEAEVGPLN